MIQVRLKDAPPEEVVALARALVGALAVPVIVNDRVDVALAAGAAGAHLGQEDPPLDRLRSHVPPRIPARPLGRLSGRGGAGTRLASGLLERGSLLRHGE